MGNPSSNEPVKSSNWMARVFVLLLAEKFIAALFFALTTFIIPFGSGWLKPIFLSVGSLMVIDGLYGRLVFCVVIGVWLKLHKSSRPIAEALLYFGSLLFTFCIVILVTGEAEILLFWGKHPWNCIAFYLTVTALVISIGVAVYEYRDLVTARRDTDPPKEKT